MVTRQYIKYTNIRKTQKTRRNMMWTTATYLQHNKQHITRSLGPKQACAGHNRLHFGWWWWWWRRWWWWWWWWWWCRCVSAFAASRERPAAARAAARVAVKRAALRAAAARAAAGVAVEIHCRHDKVLQSRTALQRCRGGSRPQGSGTGMCPHRRARSWRTASAP